MAHRRYSFCAVVALLILTSCGTGTESHGTSKIRNAALGAADLVNPDFSPTGGGWMGDGYTLGAGCQAGGGNPSLGVWMPNALTFGYAQRTVTQAVVVPYAGPVVFTFEGAVRGDDVRSTFQASLSDANENVNTGIQTGSALVTPKSFSLTVTTASDNEKVLVSFSGKSGNYWAGCYGAIITKTAISSSPAPTTTTAVMLTTTTVNPIGQSGSGANGTFAVGDTGPGQGTVIWSEFSRDLTTMTVTEKYLEVSPTGWAGTVDDLKAPMGFCKGWVNTNDGIGAGLANTDALIGCITGENPATKARAYRGGGKSDWYIPTLAELKVMYKYRDMLGINGKTPSQEISYMWSSNLFRGGTDSWYSSAFTSANYVAYQPEQQMFMSYYIRPVRVGTVTKSIKRCSSAVDCEIWDIGPGDGQVFLAATSKGNATGKAFEIVNTSVGDGVRGCPGIAGKSNTAIGSGAANTEALTSQCSDSTSFAIIAAKYNGGGKNDWFVPSQDELVKAATYGIGFTFFWVFTSTAQAERITTYQVDVTARDLSISASGGTNVRQIFPVRMIS